MKFRPWESQKVQDERVSWEAPRKALYVLRDMMERVLVWYVGFN